ncbi:MAG: hypothetical protein MUO67_08745 [Anaerolineales bacterium]|nr:hypothetical protein [Anaerolineales bacterium]
MEKKRTRARTRMEWRTIDLHLHTPASVDYQQPEVTPLDLLYKAEVRRLDIIDFTDTIRADIIVFCTLQIDSAG